VMPRVGSYGQIAARMLREIASPACRPRRAGGDDSSTRSPGRRAGRRIHDRRDRGRHVGVPHRPPPPPPRLVGGTLPRQQRDRQQAPIGPDPQGQRLARQHPRRVCLGRSRSRDTYLAAQFWRLSRRIGKKKAAVAVGHSILVIVWHLLANDCDYANPGGDFLRPTRHRRARQRGRPAPDPRLPRHPRTHRRVTGIRLSGHTSPAASSRRGNRRRSRTAGWGTGPPASVPARRRR
jgi:hypothetical protein